MQIEKEETPPNLEDYAIYRLLTEDEKLLPKYVSTKICVSLKASYSIYNYDKTILSSLDNIHSKYRSVVFSHPENKLLSFSPPKSIDYCDFVKKYPKMGRSSTKYGENWAKSVIATEKIEGISIQLFYDKRIEGWEISTKTNIGGNYWYFTKNNESNTHRKPSSTFYDMFLDALLYPRNSSLNTNPWIMELPKEYCYSFVLQHPENQNMIPVKSPKLWLVAIYQIIHLRNCLAIQIPSFEYKQWSIFTNILGVVDFPKQLEVDNYEELQKYVSTYKNHPFRICEGVVLWNENTGERTLWKNNNYADLLLLRKISPNIQYEYFSMKRAEKLDEYMEHFPQNKKMVMSMNRQYDNFVKTLHSCYMSVYVFKTEMINDISPQFRPYIENLHKHVYLPNLHTRHPIKITKQWVCSYLDKMEPRELLFMFSYLLRERTDVST